MTLTKASFAGQSTPADLQGEDLGHGDLHGQAVDEMLQSCQDQAQQMQPGQIRGQMRQRRMSGGRAGGGMMPGMMSGS